MSQYALGASEPLRSVKPGFVGLAITFGAIWLLLCILEWLSTGQWTAGIDALIPALVLGAIWLIPMMLLWTALHMLQWHMPLGWTLLACVAFSAAAMLVWGRDLGPVTGIDPTVRILHPYLESASWISASTSYAWQTLVQPTGFRRMFVQLYGLTALAGAIIWAMVLVENVRAPLRA